ncbi:MAG: DUF721 domain-containing protein [Actinomycetes bacterium]
MSAEHPSEPEDELPSRATDPLVRARAAARRRGTPAARAARATAKQQRAGSADDRGQLSGPGPSERDPRLVGALVADLTKENDWQLDLAVGSIAGRWAELVGSDVAEHCRPERFEGGELVVVAESTAWATQLRLLAPTMLSRLAAGVGSGVVRRLTVHGPTGPSWGRGRWRVAGRGPRDTYG